MVQLLFSDVKNERFIVNGANLKYRDCFDRIALAFGKKKSTIRVTPFLKEIAWRLEALRSLITTGIQKGHMKMHLLNILNQLNANDTQKMAAINYFKTKQVSIQAVHNFLKKNKL